MTVPAALTERDTQEAISRLQYTIVGILERWNDTVKVINHWFPWIDFTNDFNRKRMFIFRGKENRDELLPELYEVLANFNRCDMNLYDHMKIRFDDQLDSIEKKFFI